MAKKDTEDLGVHTAIKLKPRQLTEILTKAITLGLTVLVEGKPGIGKTDMVTHVADKLDAKLFVFHPPCDDPTDIKGMPFLQGGTARFLPFGEMAEVIEACKRGERVVVFLDDFGQGTTAVQASWMRPIQAKSTLTGESLATATFIIATNGRTDGAGVSGILEPIKSRCSWIVHLEPDLDDFCSYLYDHDIRTEIPAFLRFRPELLHKFQRHADIQNFPCPRTWVQGVNPALRAGFSAEVELAAIAGAIGPGPAAEFTAFLRTYREMPNLDAIVQDPNGAPIPKEPSTLYAVAVGLAARATKTNFDGILRYAERLYEDGVGEVSTCLVKEAIRKTDALKSTHAFVKMASGPLGGLMLGDDG